MRVTQTSHLKKLHSDEIGTRHQLGQRIRELCESAGMREYELADEVCSASQGRISEWEIGVFEPSLKSLRRIAAAFGITVSDLLRGVM